MQLYHVSGWSALALCGVGSEFTLRPGTQCAEGVGVYFAEGQPRFSAAEGTGGHPTAVICLDAGEGDAAGWWQSKAAKARKFGKPRTWHSDGKSLRCIVQAIGEYEAVPLLQCAWTFA